MAVYAAMIDRMDRNIGKVLKKLEQIGELDNTLILFASDNGCSAEVVRNGFNVPGEGPIGSMTRWTSLGGDWGQRQQRPPFGYFKNYSHEGGICTPLVAHWPQTIKQPGTVSNRLGHFIDIMPTLLDVSGAKYPRAIQGRIRHPLRRRKPAPNPTRRTARTAKNRFSGNGPKGRAVRTNQWKMVSWNGGWELYDASEDKTETNNVANHNPAVKSYLEGLYQEWLKRCGAEE